jgi:hypothetical protein
VTSNQVFYNYRLPWLLCYDVTCGLPLRNTAVGTCDCSYGTGFDLRNAEGNFSVQSYEAMIVFGSYVVEDAGRVELQIVSLGLWLSIFPTLRCAFMFFRYVRNQKPITKFNVS